MKRSAISFAAALLLLTIVTAPALAEQTGPARRVLAADYETRRIALLDADGNAIWEHPIQQIHDAHVLDNGHVLFQTTWTQVVEVDTDGEVVWEYDAAAHHDEPVEVHAFQRLADGVTMIAESGPARIIEINREGDILREVPLTVDNPHPHHDTRLVRKTKDDTYLVAHERDQTVREYDAEGNVIWSYRTGTEVYSAIRLDNGNTLIGTGNGNRVDEVTPDGEVAWSLTSDDLPGIELVWITQVARLANGNTLVVNCHAGPENPQILEVTADKELVWSFRDFEHFGNSLPAAHVLDIDGAVIR